MEVYVDMDGVIADFFTEYAKLAGVKSGSYRDIPPAKVDPTLDKMVGTDFFARLPKFSTADKLLDIVVDAAGSYNICSSPLRGDHEGSAKYKNIWIKKHLNPQPKHIYIVANKAKYAKSSNGMPNVLIDDRGSNISAWEAAGGIGIKYQADEDSLKVVLEGLKRARRVAQGEQEHDPQKLSSLDRGKMIAVHTSGDKDESINSENFADGKKPGRKGLAKRSGVNTKASVSSLRKTAKHSTGEKARMAHWLANMKAGKAKHKLYIMKIRDILESATAGATSSANVGTVVSPHLAIGKDRGKKSYTGSPGKSGTKAPAVPKVKQAKNPDGTAKNALDIKTNIFGGGSALKR